MRPGRVVVFSLAMALAGMAASPALARRPPPVIVPPPPLPPPPPPMPGVGLGSRFVADAAAYETYVEDAGSISPAFTDADNIQAELKTGVGYEPGQLRRGAVAYAAIAALTDPVFVADVRRLGATPQQRYEMVAKIFASPARALDFADGYKAAGLAKQALAAAGMRLFDDGNRVKMSAYSIQHQAWSLTEIPDRDGRAAAVKRLSSTQHTAPLAEEAQLEALVEGGPSTIDPEGPAGGPYSLLVVRAVALAALAAIGEANDDAAPRLRWMSDDYYLDHCLAEAKLALFECLAVAKPNYEDIFCLGQHAMKDTGACLVKATGAVVPIEIETTPIKLPRVHVRRAPVRRRRA